MLELAVQRRQADLVFWESLPRMQESHPGCPWSSWSFSTGRHLATGASGQLHGQRKSSGLPVPRSLATSPTGGPSLGLQDGPGPGQWAQTSALDHCTSLLVTLQLTGPGWTRVSWAWPWLINVPILEPPSFMGFERHY